MASKTNTQRMERAIDTYITFSEGGNYTLGNKRYIHIKCYNTRYNLISDKGRIIVESQIRKYAKPFSEFTQAYQERIFNQFLFQVDLSKVATMMIKEQVLTMF